MLYTVSDELTEIDRQHLEVVVKPENPQDNSPLSKGEVELDGLRIKIKDVPWRNSRDYRCAFCMTVNPGKNAKCKRCSAHLIQFGNIDFMYKTNDRKRLGTGEATQLRHLYAKLQHESRIKQQR
jgi:hypothetical protein